MGGAQPDRRSGEHRADPVVVGIVPAGGSGERLGADRPKAFVVVGGRPMLDWSLEALGSVCDRVVVAVPAGLEQEGPGRVAGGASRSESVRNAVAAAPEADVYVVHDAARPMVTPALAQRCLDALEEPWAGVVAGARVSDTIKRVGFDNAVAGTLDRDGLRAIQTPQVFGAGWLRQALAVDRDTLMAATDDAALVEAAGGLIRVVDAPPENIKVTTQTDLRLAELLLRAD